MKNINEKIKKYSDEIMRRNNSAAIMFTDNHSLIYGNGQELLAILALILEKLREFGIPEILLEKAFEISKKPDEKNEKDIVEKEDKIKKIREILDFLEEIDNEW